jgi:flagellar basal-body rod protein FlgB
MAIAISVFNPIRFMIEKLFASPSYNASKVLMDVAVLRQEIFASNLANLETPGYKRLQVSGDFTKVFNEALKSGSLSKVGKLQMPSVSPDLASPAQRKDGNNVVMQDELLAMGKNGSEYEALVDFVSGSMRTLKVAITGRTQ